MGRRVSGGHQISYFKAIIHRIRFWLGLRPRPRWVSPQCPRSPPSWILGVLLLREVAEGKGREGKVGGGRGRGEGKKDGREGEGKTLWICSPRKIFLATPLVKFEVCCFNRFGSHRLRGRGSTVVTMTSKVNMGRWRF